MKLSIVIPYRNTKKDPMRSNNYYTVLGWFYRIFPKAETVVSTDNLDGPFSRSRAINDGVECSSGDTIIICDADLITPKPNYETAIDLLDLHPFVIPFGKVYHLFLRTTEKVWTGDQQINFAEFRQNINVQQIIDIQNSKLAGGTCVITREFFDKMGGYDPRFIGWGWEDTEFCYRVKDRLGDYPILADKSIYHLAHDREPYVDDNYFLARETEERIRSVRRKVKEEDKPYI